MSSQSVKPVTIPVGTENHVSGLWLQPLHTWACVVLAHGAGAGMRHSFMEAIAAELASEGLATLRYQFPYMERGSKRPDPPALCHATVRAAVSHAASLAPGMPLFAGGKSFGGRMTSQAQALAGLEHLRGLMFLGFPLHAAGKPDDSRAEHLAKVSLPMLFLQGTRDELASLDLLEPMVEALGKHATLHLMREADHSFHVPARSGRNDAAVRAELVQTIAAWARPLTP